MIKKFCDKCERELLSESDYKVSGWISIGSNTYYIGIEMELESNQHVCRGCQIDAIMLMDKRPKKVARPNDLVRMDEEDEDIFVDVYIPPPLEKPKQYPKKAPTGLTNLKGIVE